MKNAEVKEKLEDIAIVITTGLRLLKEHHRKLPESFFKFGIWFMNNVDVRHHASLVQIEEVIGEDGIREWLRGVLVASGLYKQVGEDDLEVAS